MRVFTGADVSTLSIEQSAMISGRDRDRSRHRERDFGGRGSFGGDRAPMVT